MVRFGAKEAGLIVWKNEWWRLLSSIMLHGGILHIIPNGAIQVIYLIQYVQYVCVVVCCYEVRHNFRTLCCSSIESIIISYYLRSCE